MGHICVIYVSYRSYMDHIWVIYGSYIGHIWVILYVSYIDASMQKPHIAYICCFCTDILLDAVFRQESDGTNHFYIFGFPTKLFTGNKTPYLNIS